MPQRTWGSNFELFVARYFQRHPTGLRSALDAGFGTALGARLASGSEEKLCQLADAPEWQLQEEMSRVQPTAEQLNDWQRTITYVRALVQRHGPFDGIAGFSEGAAAAYHLLCLQRSGAAELGLSGVRFMIGMSPWRSPLHLDDPPPLHLPLLATVGADDAHMFREQLAHFEEVCRAVGVNANLSMLVRTVGST